MSRAMGKQKKKYKSNQNNQFCKEISSNDNEKC